MSLVEKAIKRLRGDDSISVPTPRRTYGRIVDGAALSQAGRSLVIDQEALRAAGMLPPKHQERQIAGQYRHIKRPLLAAAMGRGRDAVPRGRLIMTASSVPGEGKTFTAINLAFSMALEKDLQVVLIDADVAKPQISRIFCASAEKGLIDVLSDESLGMEEVILPTNVPNLYLLPAGAPREGTTELLASSRMREVTDELLRDKPNLILLFDSPPLLLTTEAAALADIVGQIVFVVHAGRTEQRIILDALSRLPETSSPCVVLNQSTLKGAGSYNYYGYGYGEAGGG